MGVDERRKELLKVFEDVDESKRVIAVKLIDEMIYLETRMEYLKKYPFIRVHPTNPELQKETFAGKQFSQVFNQYTNLVRLLCSLLSKSDSEAESPLRLYLKGIEKCETR